MLPAIQARLAEGAWGRKAGSRQLNQHPLVLGTLVSASCSVEPECLSYPSSSCNTNNTSASHPFLPQQVNTRESRGPRQPITPSAHCIMFERNRNPRLYSLQVHTFSSGPNCLSTCVLGCLAANPRRPVPSATGLDSLGVRVRCRRNRGTSAKLRRVFLVSNHSPSLQSASE